MSDIKKSGFLIVGGVHGDEPSGVEVVQTIKINALRVGALLANPQATKRKIRFTETDLNRSFSVNAPISYEERRAKYIAKFIKKYLYIIDIHNTKAHGTTCAIIVGPPNRFHLALAEYFGFERIVIMEPSGSLIGQKPSHSISLEIASNDIGSYPVARLVKKIIKISKLLPSVSSKNFEMYKYVKGIQRKTLLRAKVDLKIIQNFKPLTASTKKQLKLLTKREYFPIFYKKNRKETISFTLIEKIS